MKIVKKYLGLILTAVLAVVAICLMAGPFVSFTVTLLGGKSTTSYSGFQFAFGDDSVEMCVGVLFIFILGLLGLILAVAGFAMPKKLKVVSLCLTLLAVLSFLVAGIMCFCVIPLTGTGLNVGDGGAGAKTSLGACAIVDGIVYILCAIPAALGLLKAGK